MADATEGENRTVRITGPGGMFEQTFDASGHQIGYRKVEDGAAPNPDFHGDGRMVHPPPPLPAIPVNPPAPPPPPGMGNQLKHQLPDFGTAGG